MFEYPVEFTPDDNGTVMATVPDVPGVRSFGDDEDDALFNVRDALETVLSGLITDRADVPAPSKAGDCVTVSPSLLGTLKISLYQAMRSRGWRKADLARATGLGPRQVDRLLDLRHASTVAQLEAAIGVCGQRYRVETLNVPTAGERASLVHV